MIPRSKTARIVLEAWVCCFLLNGCTTNCGHPSGEPQFESYAYYGRILDGESGKFLMDVDVWVGEDLYARTSDTGFSVETGELCSSIGHPAYRLRARKNGYSMLDTTFHTEFLETEITNKNDGLHQRITFPDMPLMRQ